MEPVIAACKQGEGFFRNNRWTLCGNGESTLPLLRKKVFISNRNCDACCFLVEDIEPMTYVLAEFEDEFPDLCRIFKVLNCRHTMSDGFVRGFNIPDCDGRCIKTVGETPYINTAFSESSLKKVDGKLRDLSDCINTN